MNTDSKEFTEILQRVPRWHYLTPGEPLKITDSIYWCERWIECAKDDAYDRSIENFVPDGADDTPCRRPIPETVRRSMAWWALYNKLATIASENFGYTIQVIPPFNRVGNGIWLLQTGTAHAVLTGMRKFESQEKAAEAIILLGEHEIIRNFQEGQIQPMQWVLENTK